MAAFTEYLRLTSLQTDQAAFLKAQARFLKFIHHRAFEKICTRLKYGDKLWKGGDPLALLAKQPVGIVTPTRFTLPTLKLLEEALTRQKLTSDGEHFTVDSTNAVKWLGVFLYLRGLLNELVVDGTQSSRLTQDTDRCKVTLKAEKYKYFLQIIEALHAVTCTKLLVKALQSAYIGSENVLTASLGKLIRDSSSPN